MFGLYLTNKPIVYLCLIQSLISSGDEWKTTIFTYNYFTNQFGIVECYAHLEMYKLNKFYSILEFSTGCDRNQDE